MSILDYRDDPICRWDIRASCVRGTQQDKAEEFARRGLVERVSFAHWKVHPIDGYNSTTYDVYLMDDDSFSCSCQWNRRIQKTCSHIKAVVIVEGLVNKKLTQDDMFRVLGVKNETEFSQLVERTFA